MTLRWRLLAMATGLCLILGARPAFSQTVIVRDAAPGAPVELLWNSDTIGTATASADGIATIPASRFAANPTGEGTVRAVVDICGNLSRVILVDVGLQPPPIAGACDRTELPSNFVVRSVTTFVVSVGGSPAVFVRQGPAPPSWVGGADERAARVWHIAPSGVMVSGAVGLGLYSDAITVACGDAPNCTGSRGNGAAAVGAAFWVTKFVAAGVDLFRIGDVTASGGETNYTFRSVLQSRVTMITARAGGQVGPARVYGMGGVTYQTAASTTTQSTDATATSPALSETFGLKTTGWGWVAGGGFETWVQSRIGVYVEGGRLALRGKATAGEGSLDDSALFVLVGARVRVSR